MTYDTGDLVRIEGEFKDINGIPADPTGVALRIKAPRSDPFTFTYGVGPVIIRTAVGVYRADVELTGSGKWRFKWIGTGALIVVEEGTLFVRPAGV